MVLCCVGCTGVSETHPQDNPPHCSPTESLPRRSFHGALLPRRHSRDATVPAQPDAANATTDASVPRHKHTNAYLAASGPQEVSLQHGATPGAPLEVTSTIATCTNTSNGSVVRPATGSTSGSRGPGSIAAAAPAAGSPVCAATDTAELLGHSADSAGTALVAAALQRKRIMVDATKEQLMAAAERRLDALGERLLLERFVMLGPQERRRGGQAVVQFVRDVKEGRQYGLKFFLSQAAFEAERRIYEDSPLGKLLPQLDAVCANRDRALCDVDDRPLPPFVVMERGESLDEWARRRKPDMWTAMPVVSAIAMRLYSMHIAGYAHRDLKPGNVMWLPRESQWTLIDFGFAAPLGSRAGMGFTLSYAAPEVIAAWLRRDTHTVATPATDAWALGVMVFELLTGRPAFGSGVDAREAAIAKLVGDRALPWEALQAADRRKLGAFRGPVLELLRRDPSRRPTMASFYHNCRLLIDEGCSGSSAGGGQSTMSNA